MGKKKECSHCYCQSQPGTTASYPHYTCCKCGDKIMGSYTTSTAAAVPAVWSMGTGNATMGFSYPVTTTEFTGWVELKPYTEPESGSDASAG